MEITITKNNINQYTIDKFEDILIFPFYLYYVVKFAINKYTKGKFDNILNFPFYFYYVVKFATGKYTKDKKDKNDNITKIKWKTGELDRKVIDNFSNLCVLFCGYNNITTLEPLSNCVNLQWFNCDNNKITSLEPLSNCVNLQWLNCKYNDIISLEPLSNCINLRKLYCDGNRITSLGSFYNCVNLKKLYCNGNIITSLESLSNCINLQILQCNHNKIISLEPLSNCINLQILQCNRNKIISLEPLSNCIDLKELYCNFNQITSLEPLSNCVNLKKLSCGSNQITSFESLSNCLNLEYLYCKRNQITLLEPLIHLRRLCEFDFSNNPIEIPTIQIQRILNRIKTNRNSSIYNDNQNVHDTEIQRTVCDSVQSLLRDPKNIFSIDDIINSDLNQSTIESIIEYCQDQTVHSIHLITYVELLALVWSRIINSTHKSELIRILEEQIADSECKCYTGRFNRTLSVLVGFFDDIQINISDKSRISAIILNTGYKIIPYDPVKHKEAAIKELIEAGYLETDFKDWIDAIDDL